jgi:hypothetical protein
MAGSGQMPLNEAQRLLAYNKSVLDGFKSVALLLVTVFLIRGFLHGKLSTLGLSAVLLILVVVDLWMVDSKIVQPRPAQEKVDYFHSTRCGISSKKTQAFIACFRFWTKNPATGMRSIFIQNILGYSPAKLRIYQEFLEETALTARTVMD